MDTITVDGHRARIHREGEGRPLLYLHSELGEMGGLALFDALGSAGLAVTAPEIPGFGKSEPFDSWRQVEDVVLWLRQLLDQLGTVRTVVAGSALGGWLAAELAVWFPERVDALVLLDPFGLHLPGAPVHELFGIRHDELLRRVFPGGVDLAALLTPALDGDDDPQAWLLHFFRAMEATARIGWNPYLHDPKLRGRLGLVTAPTLVLHGSDDGILPLSHAEAYCDGIAGAVLEVIEGCGHLPALEQPLRVAELVTGFIGAAAPPRL